LTDIGGARIRNDGRSGGGGRSPFSQAPMIHCASMRHPTTALRPGTTCCARNAMLGLQQLRAKIDTDQWKIEGTSVSPNINTLGNPKNYEIVSINPLLGQVINSDKPSFTITVRSRFIALATPSDKPVGKQLEKVFPESLKRNSRIPCATGEESTFSVTDWRWDVTQLIVEAHVQ
jgi:hypothetical protein